MLPEESLYFQSDIITTSQNQVNLSCEVCTMTNFPHKRLGWYDLSHISGDLQKIGLGTKKDKNFFPCEVFLYTEINSKVFLETQVQAFSISYRNILNIFFP